MSRSKKLCDFATIALFLGSLCLPFWDELQRPASMRASKQEFRMPAKAPLLPGNLAPFSEEGRDFLASEKGVDWLSSARGLRWMTRYPGRYQDFHADSFGFRDVFVRNYCDLMWQFFGVSPLKIAYRGQDDWIFLGVHSEQVVWRGASPFTEGEVDAWARSLRARHDFFAERGIEYLYCVAPDKGSVYPEFMPAWANDGESRLEQLQAYLGDEDVGLLSLLDAVVAEKARDQGEDLTYRRLGSHWTDRGAKAGCDAICERLRKRWPFMRTLPLDNYDYVQRSELANDDMGPMLRVNDAALGERQEFGLDLKGPSFWKPVSNDARHFISKSLTPDYPKAWLQVDSFGTRLRPFIFEHLGDSECHWDYGLDLDRVFEFGPDIVIEVMVERGFNFLAPSLLHEANDPELAERFARSSEHLLALPNSGSWNGISPNDRAFLEVKEEGLAIEGVRLGAGVWLPPFSCPPKRDLLVRIVVTVEEADKIRLVHSAKSAPEYDGRRRQTINLKPGRNEILIELLAPELTGRMLLFPFVEGRNAILHELEVRAVGF